MNPNELTIKAKGVSYQLHLIQDRLRKKRNENSVYTSIERKGKVEARTSLDGRFNLIKGVMKGRFNSMVEEGFDGGQDYERRILMVQDKDLVIEVTEYIDYHGCVTTSGIMRRCLGGKWKETELENPEICWNRN